MILIKRRLWRETKDGRVELRQDDLSNFAEPLVILGEAGMGKSHLLEWLADYSDYAYCTASQLINRHNPQSLLGNKTTLLIDALDEVSVHREGDAIDLVLRKLGELDYPRFILSSRVADWRSATGLQSISEQYSQRPAEVHLIPFDDSDALYFLSARLEYEAAKNAIEHFRDLGFNELLGNPQTLDFIARVAKDGDLPNTRRELFERAVEELRTEYRDSKAHIYPDRDTGLDAAGAAFAAIILTGSEVIVRKSPANMIERELQLADASTLAGGDAIETMFNTLLFKANGVDRFSYLHRRVGEFLGAGWLAKQADTPRKRKRLLSLFHNLEAVPSSLRGIHAWLAKDPMLAKEIIAADPMGVIEYGDADDLAVDQARILLSSLERLAQDNPRFHNWGQYSLRSVGRPELIDDLRRLLGSSDTNYGLALLVIEAIRGSGIANVMKGDLWQILYEQQRAVVVRQAAGKLLIELVEINDWPEVIYKLIGHGNEDSIELSIDIINQVGYAQFSDQLIVDVVFAWEKVRHNTISVIHRLESSFPVTRIENLLDCFNQSNSIRRQENLESECTRHVVPEFISSLVVRWIESGSYTCGKLWPWLESLSLFTRCSRELSSIFQNDAELRFDLQCYVLFDLSVELELWQRIWKLDNQISFIKPTPEDVVKLLGMLDPNDRKDQRWRSIFLLAKQNTGIEENVRAAARPFVIHRTDMLQWIDKQRLLQSYTYKWKKRQFKAERKSRAIQATNFAGHRKHYKSKISEVRKGNCLVVTEPAKVYLNFFRNIGEDLPSYQKVVQWLGRDLAADVYRGFEAFLKQESLSPTLRNVVEFHISGRSYKAEYVTVAALAERLRDKVGFDDLSDERLMIGLFVLHFKHIDNFTELEMLRQALKVALQNRKAWELTLRSFYEPQFLARVERVNNLSLLTESGGYESLVLKLAVDWLHNYSNLPLDCEPFLIEVLLKATRFRELIALKESRGAEGSINRQNMWNAVGLVVDYYETVTKLGAVPIEAELLWAIRDLTSNDYRRKIVVHLNCVHLAWVISTFRVLWPYVGPPKGGWFGNRNAQDASEYIIRLINQLGSDLSEESYMALIELRNEPRDSYSETIKAVVAEQTRNRVESNYNPPKLAAIRAITSDEPPKHINDLQAVIIDELKTVQAKVDSDDAESWRGFYDDQGVPHKEERCRDHLLGLLRQGSQDIEFSPETHVAGDKEVDITCSIGSLRLPIEIKGQWHRELWKGADEQLNRLYASDWRADGHGIYLVFWFGQQDKAGKRLKGPAKGIHKPETPSELQEMLTANSMSTSDGRIKVLVFDLTKNRRAN